ncbi:MAG TPA: R3H domain-containing nucleic acid-binding protein [Actinomycetota bacterium]
MSEERPDEMAEATDAGVADVEALDVEAPDVQSGGAEAEAESDDDAGEGELLDDQADIAEDFLNGLLDVLDMDGEAEADFDGDVIAVEVTGPDLAILIGRYGATLESLQELTRAAVQHATSAHALLTLDIGGYRQRQRERLEAQAREAAEQVRTTRQPLLLEPMSSFERKMIHDALHDAEGVRTESEGEEPERYVVVRPD